MTLKSFGRYQIKEELGRGGMAIVYHAFDPRFNRDVALKILPREFLFDQTFRSRFEREAQSIAALEHSAILPVYDFGEENEQPFFVMRYMPGGSLDRRIKRGELPFDDIVPILERIAAALDFAHAHNVIHRDVKPANILFDRASDPYLGDFGIVKLTESTAQLTSGGMVGTPAYMAPEMARRGNITPLIDVYALGITLYQMITGRQPYDAETPLGLLMAHGTEPIPDIRDLRPDLSEAIQEVIERGMAKDPMDRYQSAGALAAAFYEALQDSSPPAEQVIERPDAPPTIQEPEPIMSPAGPDAPTVDIGEDTATPMNGTVAPPEPPPIPDTKRRASIPWVWIGGIGAVIVVGIVGLLALLNGRGKPSETPVPTTVEESVIGAENTQAPTSIPLGYPGNLVTNNDQWTPVIDEFNGVQMALVPAGCFMMGSEDHSDEQPIHKVCFDEPFWIDVYEVTNAQFETFGGEAGQSSNWTEGNRPYERISWTESEAFCNLRGARLPTEAEWEYAARGPDNLVYPWGDDFVADNVVYGSNSDSRTWDAGSKPGGVSWVGAYDLSGNVLEWVNDWYDSDYYASSPESNPQGPDTGDYRVLRGGSWTGSKLHVRAADRDRINPSLVSSDFGFRCALSYSP